MRRGSIVEQYHELHKDAAEYMDQQALKDLEEYRKSLPQEAVYERCFCFQEEAGLQKNHPQTYRWEHVEKGLPILEEYPVINEIAARMSSCWQKRPPGRESSTF